MFLMGNVCNAIGLSLAPQSDFAVMGSLTLVTNAVNSRCLLGEGLNHIILIGIAVIIAGSMVAVLFGAPSRCRFGDAVCVGSLPLSLVSSRHGVVDRVSGRVRHHLPLRARPPHSIALYLYS